VVRNDIKIAAKVIGNLDRRWGLWQKNAENHASSSNGEEKNGQNEDEVSLVDTTVDTLVYTLVDSTRNAAVDTLVDSTLNAAVSALVDIPVDTLVETPSLQMIGLGSTNPVLENITDYLIEEASAEEEELLGKNNDLEDGEEGEEGNSIARDDDLVAVLDRMLFYLRVVHSVDFYNHSEYPNEDEMPNRCGIMHARTVPAPGTNVTQAELEEYVATFEKKMGSFMTPRAVLTDEDANKLGMKDEEDEVEKFVQVGTRIRSTKISTNR
jgi:Arsenite-resistance protein 2